MSNSTSRACDSTSRDCDSASRACNSTSRACVVLLSLVNSSTFKVNWSFSCKSCFCFAILSSCFLCQYLLSSWSLEFLSCTSQVALNVSSYSSICALRRCTSFVRFWFSNSSSFCLIFSSECLLSHSLCLSISFSISVVFSVKSSITTSSFSFSFSNNAHFCICCSSKVCITSLLQEHFLVVSVSF